MSEIIEIPSLEKVVKFLKNNDNKSIEEIMNIINFTDLQYHYPTLSYEDVEEILNEKEEIEEEVKETYEKVSSKWKFVVYYEKTPNNWIVAKKTNKYPVLSVHETGKSRKFNLDEYDHYFYIIKWFDMFKTRLEALEALSKYKVIEQ